MELAAAGRLAGLARNVDVAAAGTRQLSDEAYDAAMDVMVVNDAGRHTVPSAKTFYKHEWNWDGELASLGQAVRDPRRGWIELDTLFGAQRESGFVPHMMYAPGVNYKPGPEIWGHLMGPDGRYQSAISNPPLAGTITRHLLEATGNERAARELIPKIHRWDTWFFRERMPQRATRGPGEPVMVDPWEGGKDNIVYIDVPMSRLGRTPLQFERTDLLHAAAETRPTTETYERYMWLKSIGIQSNWDQLALATTGPYRVIEPGVSGILAAGAHDVSVMAESLGMHRIADEAAEQSRNVVDAMNARVRSDGMLYPLDMVSGRELEHVTADMAMATMAPGLDRRAVEAVRRMATDGELSSDFGVLSTSSLDSAFTPVNYWRGPTWVNNTWLTMEGMRRNGEPATANLLRDRMFNYLETAGMTEYANPITGEALGASGFSWSAALGLWEANAMRTAAAGAVRAR